MGEPLGHVVFRSCKDIFVKIILEQFKKMQGFISSQCDQSLSSGPGAARRKRSYGGGYYPGGYDPSTIWFQYLLCHEQKISCYFFTQGWNEKEFGQYYLYENLFDTGFDKLGHASSGTDDILTLALLGGLGGSHQYPHQGYSSYKKRRDANDEDDTGERRRRSIGATEEPKSKSSTSTFGRRRRSTGATQDRPKSSTLGRRRRSTGATEDPLKSSTLGRRRRSTGATTEEPRKSSTLGRRRRSTGANEEPPKSSTLGRRRRSTEATKEPARSTLGRRRRSTEATEATMIECESDDGSCPK